MSTSDRIVLSPQEIRTRRILSTLGRSLLLAVTAVAALAVLIIIFFIARDAVPFFREYSLRDFLFTNAWYPAHQPAQFGAKAIFMGSLIVTLTSVIIAVPLGILAAVCLSDMVSFNVRQFLKPVIELLAAIPSVVWGFFALVVMAPFLQDVLGVESGANALNASVILAVMALPTIVSVSEDALQAAGRELREGSYALGATRAETLVKVVLPAAMSGIFSAALLGIMRAVGETMVVWMASGNATQIPTPIYNLLQPVRTLTATIAGDMGEADQMTGSAHYHVLFAMGLSLLLFSFLCNMAGEWIVRRQRKRLRGM